ncbi:MAG: caspase family protein, partial [Bacteroidetes bacterium]
MFFIRTKPAAAKVGKAEISEVAQRQLIPLFSHKKYPKTSPGCTLAPAVINYKYVVSLTLGLNIGKPEKNDLMPNSTKHIGSFRPKAPVGGGPHGKNYLFAIAIDEYAHCPKLYNPVRDALELKAVLSERYDFEPQNIITLFNEAATESNIIHAFRDLARSISPSDNLVLFFSGHGEFDDVFNEGYWIPVDARRGAWEDYIPNSKIRTILNAIRAHHIFLIADSCFSGSLFMTGKDVAANRLDRDPSRWGLTAGRNEIVDDGHPGAHSPFADSLLYHLKNNNKPLGVME